MKDRSVTVQLVDALEPAFLAYSVATIVSRAIPDVRDGLKPVQRRILWAMLEAGVSPNKPHVKSARIVGETMGKYHPHGDSAVYDALVRMTQDFVGSAPLVDGQGNWGTPDHAAAASRYTEARLSNVGAMLLDGIRENTVTMRSNFDESTVEPVVLPARFPNLLINGAQGIAVGLSTSIPTHNPGEVCAGALRVLEDPGVAFEQVRELVVAPDFATGSRIVTDTATLDEIYRTGRGAVTCEAIVQVNEGSRGSTRLLFTCLPPGVSVESVVTKLVNLANDGKLDAVSEVIDATDAGGSAVSVTVKRGHDATGVIDLLYAQTGLRSNVQFAMVALVDGAVPKLCSLMDILGAWATHQMEVTLRRSEFRLGKEQARYHIVVALVKALDAIDRVIRVIRAAETTTEAKTALETLLRIDETQSAAIVEMPLKRLTSLEISELRAELTAIESRIQELERLIADEPYRRVTTVREVTELTKDLRTTPRMSEIVPPGGTPLTAVPSRPDRNTQPQQPGSFHAALYVTHDSATQTITVAVTPNGNATELAIAPDGYLCAITTTGDLHVVAAHTLRVGTSLATELFTADALAMFTTGPDRACPLWAVTVSPNGKAKRTPLGQLTTKRVANHTIMQTPDRNIVAAWLLTDTDTKSHDTWIATSNGYVARFPTDTLPSQISGTGVAAIRLTDTNTAIAAGNTTTTDLIGVVTEHGWTKAVPITEFPTKGRGGQGVVLINCDHIRGNVTHVEGLRPQTPFKAGPAAGTIPTPANRQAVGNRPRDL